MITYFNYSVNLVGSKLNHIYLSDPKIESIIVCPIGHPMISTHYLWEREICNFSRGRRGVTINDTRIKYLLVAKGRLYEVTDIDFWDLTIEAVEMDWNVSDVPEEVLNIGRFKDFRIKLVNGSDRGNIIDFEDWGRGKDIKSCR